MRTIQLSLGCLLLAGALCAPVCGATSTETEAALARGQALAEQGDLPAAQAALEAAAVAFPESSAVHARLAGVQLLGQHYTDAIRSFQVAIRLGEPGGQPFVGMGMAYLHLGQYGPARAALVEARARGVNHEEDVERLLQWLDARTGGAAPGHP